MTDDGRTERTYEQDLQRLTEVVELLERGQLGLEESVRLFEEGVTLAARCEQKLEAVEGQVRVLLERTGLQEPSAGRPNAGGAP